MPCFQVFMRRRSLLPSVAELATRNSLAGGRIALAQPRTKSEISLEHCLLKRRSVRSYRDAALSVADISQLLWAAQGITGEGYLRTAPSAGALYPLEIYLAAGNVDELSPGLYHYRPKRHELVVGKPGDFRRELARAALGQDCIAYGAATILFAAVYARTSGKYGQRAARYVHMEAGHAAQNVCLQATALGLGAVTVGAFDDDEVKRVAALPDSHEPIYLMPVGPR
jgi:SagB-type dehydrogenase family enzyme